MVRRTEMEVVYVLRCLLVMFLAAPALALAQEATQIERTVRVPMRDGVELAADLYLPEGSGPFPTLIHITPYSRPTSTAHFFASHSYAVLVVSQRGRFGSEGTFNRAVNNVIDRQDGYDIIEWAARQPWSTGPVGTYGVSGSGWTQLAAATARPPHLKAMFVRYSTGDRRCSWVHRGVYGGFMYGWWAGHVGMRRLDARQDWDRWLTDWKQSELPLLATFLHSELHDFIRHPADHEFWRQSDLTSEYRERDIPAYHETGWYDGGWLAWNLRDFKAISSKTRSEAARKAQKLIVGPWIHGGGIPETDTVRFGPAARMQRRDLHLRWFDYWLKGIDTGITEQAPLQLFVMGANRWLDAESWPVAETRYTRYYLRAGQGQATSSLNDGWLIRQAPDKNEKADAYMHDPYDPVPTIGGPGSLRMGYSPGPADHRPSEAKSLSFTTAPLEKDLLVIGEVRGRFFASSSAADTDFILTLTDVYPNGYSAHLVQNGLGAMYSVGESLKPGEVYEFNLNLNPTANLFKGGHRIRVSIASSSFPGYLPNPGTGEPRYLATKCVTAENKVYHNSQYPSAIELPVLDPQSVPYRPTAEMTSPVKDYFDSGEPVLLEAQATAYGGSKVRTVEFIVDGKTIANDTDAPYVFNWTGAVKGGHSIKAKVYDSKGSAKESSPVTVYVGVQALERSVSRSTDDAEEFGDGQMYLNSSDLELVTPDRFDQAKIKGDKLDQVVGIRFQSIQIPKGAEIKKAYLQFIVDEVSMEQTDLTIHAELAVRLDQLSRPRAKRQTFGNLFVGLARASTLFSFVGLP